MMKSKWYALIFFFALINCYSVKIKAQNDSVNEIFSIVEEKPSFPGGEEARIDFFKQKVQYPKEAFDQRIQGTVYATFVVETDSTISNAKILRGLGYGCDEEVLRVIGLMPKWIPGKQQGKAVRVQYSIPVIFKLSPDAMLTDSINNNGIEGEVFWIVEEGPSFPGGEEARIKYLQENMNYPTAERDKGIQGCVFATFVVCKDGYIRNPKILKSIGPEFDKVVLRLINGMPRWIPGKQNNIPVNVQFNMPIKFILSE